MLKLGVHLDEYALNAHTEVHALPIMRAAVVDVPVVTHLPLDKMTAYRTIIK